MKYICIYVSIGVHLMNLSKITVDLNIFIEQYISIST
jgi:hypothetical protein